LIDIDIDKKGVLSQRNSLMTRVI